LREVVQYLRWIATGEGLEVSDAALSLIARAARGSFRDAGTTLDQLNAATDGEISVQAVLELLGAVEEEALFRLCDIVADRDTGGALTFVEELSEQGQDIGRLVTDLLEHLRHLLLAQHLGEVPDTLPVTDETRERLHAQAGQLGEATVLRLCDLLAVAVDHMRQGGDPRLPLELALIKVTRPAADLSQESLAYRLEMLEQGSSGHAKVTDTVTGTVSVTGTERGTVPGTVPVEAAPAPEPPALELEQLQEAWQPHVLPAVEQRSIPAAALLRDARPVALDGDTLTLEFPPEASFHRRQAEDERNAGFLRDALYEVTSRRLALAFTVGENGDDAGEPETEHVSEEDLLALLKEEFDAREVDD
jgi:DNA polymerase-3 subunit gamma/tau